MLFILINMRIWVVFLIYFCFSSAVSGQIFIDEDLKDWPPSASTLSDAGDGSNTELDIRQIWVENDAQFLYVRFELDREIILQEDNKLALIIDFDNKLSTGFKEAGIGAELMILFGDRDIFAYNPSGTSQRLRHEDIGIFCLPSVSSTFYELKINRTVDRGSGLMTMGDQISIAMRNRITDGDVIPNNGSLFVYEMKASGAPGKVPYSFRKKKPGQLRVLSYNSARDGLTTPGMGEHQLKLIQAARPDIVCFQELYSSTAATSVTNLLNQILPLPAGQSWKAVRISPDIVTATRFCIDASLALNGTGIYLLKVGENCDQPLVIFNAHLPCCDNDADRQEEVDALMARYRVMKENNGFGFPYPKDTPTLILGDMNFVGLNRQRMTLRDGDISDNAFYGPDFKPDWDNSSLEDARPFVSGAPLTYTWYDEGNTYLPGRLDYIYYTGSVMRLDNSFIFETAFLDQEYLQDENLTISDSRLASDHLPLIVDFTLHPEKETSLGLQYELRKANCAGDSIVIKAIGTGGTPPYYFALDGGVSSLKDSFVFYANGVHCISVTDQDGTIINKCDIEVKMPEPLESRLSFSGDTLYWIGTGGIMPYLLKFDNRIFAEGEAVIVPKSGQYSVTLTDGNGCFTAQLINIVIDRDKDGFAAEEDCDDLNASVYPMAEDIPGNGIDEDCNGTDLVGTSDPTNNMMSIFPNPANSSLHIHFVKKTSWDIALVDNIGKTIKRERVSADEYLLSMEGLAVGSYFICADSSFGKQCLSVLKTD